VWSLWAAAARPLQGAQQQARRAGRLHAKDTVKAEAAAALVRGQAAVEAASPALRLTQADLLLVAQTSAAVVVVLRQRVLAALAGPQV
jgi:hypothetical protein